MISIINWIRDWKRVKVYINKHPILKRVETYDCVPAYPNQTYGVGIGLRFINSSKHSIGFFDLVFRDGYTGELLPAFYRCTLRPEIAKQELLGITIANEVVHLNPLYSNYGTINAHSYNLYESVVYPVSDKIRVNIKFAKFWPIPNFFSETTRFNKWKTKVLHLTPGEISILQENYTKLKSEQKQQ